MGRTPKPWYRASRDAWYVELGGTQHRLASGKASKPEAMRAFHRLMASEGQGGIKEDLTVALACDLYLDHSQAVHKPATYRTNQIRLQAACNQFGAVRVADLKKSKVEQWLATKGPSLATRRAYAVTLKAALAWCKEDGHTAAEPLRKLPLPPVTRRERTLAPGEREAILAASPPAFRDLLVALSESGARPHILLELEARHIDWRDGTARVPSKGRPYVVILTPRLLELVRQLAERNPTGCLFRNTRGEPWTRNAVRCMFRRICRRLNLARVSAYAYRHSFATDALERGVAPASVAALMNHTDLSMISRVYSHLSERRETLRRAAECAVAPAPESAEPRTPLAECTPPDAPQ